MNRRVVVSGLGMVTPIGITRSNFSQALFDGISGIRPIESFDTSRFSSKLGAEVQDFHPRDFISLKNLRKMDRMSRLAAASARMAVEDAGVSINAGNRDRIGIILGTAFGSTDVAAQFARVLFTDGPKMVNPILVPNTVMNAPAGHTAIELGCRGVNSTVNHQATSAETAIAYAAAELQRGTADIMLAGGVDIISEFFFEVLTRFKALSSAGNTPEGARPFDIRRNGPVVGEGAGVLCLETLTHARARGVSWYGEIAGWGLSSSPAPATDWSSNVTGPVSAIRKACQAAGILPDDIDCISASAHGGVKLDRLEVEALKAVFGNEKQAPVITSIKGATGESFSSGGIRAAAMALTLKEGTIPPTLGLTTPLTDLPFVTAPQKGPRIRAGLVNGISSGGTFASLVLRQIPPET